MSAATFLSAYDPNKVKPGWVALCLVLLLVVATFLLWRSMNTQLNRIKVPPAASFRTRRASGQDTAETPALDDPPDPPSRS